MTSLADTTYTPSEDKEILSWAEFATNLKHNPTGVAALDKLNTHLATRTTLLGTKPSSADISVYQALSPSVTQWTLEQRTGENGRPNIVRLLDFIQNSPIYGFNPETKITVNPDEILYVKPPVDAKAEKERLKKEKAAAAAAAAGGDKKPEEDKSLVDRTKEKVEKAKDKVVAAAEGTVDAAKKQKQKKEKQPKPQKAPAVASPPKPSLIDLRVGHILKAIKHPEADSLYVSTIAVGDPAGTEDTTEYEGQVCRTVCSGLNGLVPLEEMQGRKVVTVCNLKPVKMRGVKSCAMVLAASPRLKEGEVDDHKGPVELVNPPEGAKAGDRVCFQGFEGEPEGVLNPKKKIWEMFQPGFTTTDSLEVAFDASVVKELGQEGVGKLVTKDGGVCTVKTLKDAVVR